MANKYMTLEEAAAYLGMSTDKLMRLREQGEIRGFVDRGSWKFTRESVEELGRLMQTDSSPDIPIITNVPLTADEINEDVPLQADDEEFEIDFDDAFFEEDEVDAPPPVAVVEEDNEYEFEEVATDDAVEVDFDESFFEEDEEDAPVAVVEVDDEDEVEYAEVAADSAVEMDFDDSFFDDDEIKIVEDATVAADISDADIRLVAEEVGETVIEDIAFEDGALDFSSSDSDVRLAFDDSVFDSDPDLVEIGSDVQLSGDSSLDVEADLVAEELASSSVMNFSEDTGEARDSDSDVQLIEHASDSDVSFVEEADSDSDIRLPDDFVDESDESSELLVGLDTQSDIQLMTAPDENPSDESSRLLTGLDSESDMRLAGGPVNSSDESAFLLMGADSDSDVRLASAPADDNSATPGVDAGTLAAGEVAAAGLAAGLSADSNDSSRMLAGLDSDSDVRLANSTTNKGDSSDSSRLISGLAEDSDVRLSPPAGGSDDSGVLVGLDSDSDVRLDVGDSGVNAGNELPLFDSDSDVRLSVDGSDLLRGLDPTGSGVVLDSTSDEDSDVVLMTPDDSGDMFAGLSDDNDSFDSGATMAMQLPEDSDLKLIDSSVSLDDESGISLEMDDGMLLLDADESGISLEADDSGISLESLDSGAMIAPSSGITLLDDESGLTLDFDDSGISLDAGDSGIALFDDDDSGISLDPDDMGQTQPMSAVGGALANLGVSGANTMQMDIPASGDTNDSEFELAGLDDDDDDFGTDTSVLMFDDDDAGDEYSVASQPRSRRNEDDLVLEDLDAEDSFEDNLGDEEVEDDFEDEEMDDVWDAEDQDEEDDGFDAGESQVGGFVAPTGAAAAKGGAVGWVAAEDSPWGAGWTTAVSIGAILSAVSAFVGAEMIRTMWMWTQPGQPESGLLSMLGGMFGS